MGAKHLLVWMLLLGMPQARSHGKFNIAPLVLPWGSWWSDESSCWSSSSLANLSLRAEGTAAIRSAECLGGISFEAWHGEFKRVDEAAGGASIKACVPGIFINVQPQLHPDDPGLCVFQLLLHGLNATESHKDPVAVLASLTYLISSVWRLLADPASGSAIGSIAGHDVLPMIAQKLSLDSMWPPQPAFQWLLRSKSEGDVDLPSVPPRAFSETALVYVAPSHGLFDPYGIPVPETKPSPMLRPNREAALPEHILRFIQEALAVLQVRQVVWLSELAKEMHDELTDSVAAEDIRRTDSADAEDIRQLLNDFRAAVDTKFTTVTIICCILAVVNLALVLCLQRRSGAGLPEHAREPEQDWFEMTYSRDSVIAKVDEDGWQLCDEIDAASSSATYSAVSAPACTPMRECLVPGFNYTMSQKGQVVEINKIPQGSELRAGAGEVQLARCTTLPARDRDLVEFHYRTVRGLRQLETTANHAMKVHRDDGKSGALPAADVEVGDRFLALSGQGVVEAKRSLTRRTECYEAELSNPASTIFIGSGDAMKDDFIQVFGELAPRPVDDFVKLLRFRHFRGFEDILFNSESLAACRKDMEEKGYSADLSKRGLGPGKMFVPGIMAERVIHALELRKKQDKFLTPRDVVVSRAFESAVLDVVRNEVSSRSNWVCHNEILDLSRASYVWLHDEQLRMDTDTEILAVDRTFISLKACKQTVTRSVHSA